MSNTYIKLGWKQDPYSDKDYKFTQIKENLNKLSINLSSTHIIVDKFPVYNQLRLSSCVANATVGALEILMALKGLSVQLSRLFVYWNARMYTQDTDKDEGTYIRNAFQSIQKLGVCLESAWIYNPDKVFAQPPLEAYKEGNDNIIDSFYRIDSSGIERADDIETAVRSNHPVVFGTDVSKEYTYYTNKGLTWSKPDKSVGGHAMIIIGVRTNDNGTRDFLIKNSWGNYWGDNGYAWLDENYIMWDQTNDLWVPTLVPDLIF